MKRRLKTFLTSFLAALFMATLIVPLAACEDNGNNGGNNGTVVSVVSMGNKGLSGVTVTATNNGNSIVGKTDENGNTALALDKSLTYQVEFSDLPKGYYSDPEVNYTIKANSTGDVKFYIPSKVIEGESVDSKYVYKTGDVMYDFSFTTTVGGTVVTLSEELKTKKAVIINFWGSLCSNCEYEFPAIESTYQMFKDDLTVMAIDPPGAYGDTDAKIINTLSSWRLDLSFYYGLDSASIFKNFYAPAQSGSFILPISVIIDRYGVICELIVGSETDASKWQESIAWYVSDDYVPDIDEGKDTGDIEDFVPDKPSDFNAKMSDPDAISRAINKTGTDILFYADDGEYSWPWVLSSDGKSIVPLGSKHGRSYSIIYASIDFPANKALLVDYRVSSQEEYDLFEIVSDYNDLGRVTFTDSGNKDWQTAVAYIPHGPGTHQIAFVYYKGTQDDGEYEDTVYLNNLRFVDITDEKIPSSDLPYYAARDYDARNRTYKTYEDVYLNEKDGYYHVRGYENLGQDPYLLLDMTHIIPFTRSTTFYEQYISEKNCTFGGKNYYNELMSYSYVAGNSTIEGTVPVTKELHDILIALCKEEAGEDYLETNPSVWLEFCIFYLHYGAGNPIDDPAKGLAYFSAYEAKVTDVYDNETSLQQVNAIYAAQEARADALRKDANADTSEWDKIIEETTKAYEDNLATYNSVDFDNLIVPRGKVVKFTAPSAGVYHFYSVGREDNAEYICEAELFSSDLKLHTALARPIASHDSDTLFRTGSPTQFHLYHYLKEGESCYLNLMFYSTETLDTMYYAVNKVSDTEYKVLKTVTAGFYTTSLAPDTMGQLYRPIFPNGIEFKDDGYYYETSFNHRILVDFTGATRGLTSHTLENIIVADQNGTPVQSVTKLDSETGEILETVDVNFNFEGFSAKIGDETIVGKDYRKTMQEYLAKSKLVGESSLDYGLVEANKELRDILLLFMAKYDEIWVEDDWLVFCYYYEYFGANY